MSGVEDGPDEVVDLTEPAELARVEAENRIHEADKQDGWRERYEHLAKAHRAQAQQAVIVERELADARKVLKEQQSLIHDQRQAIEGLRQDVEDQKDVDRKDYDELFRVYAHLTGILAAIVGEELEGEVLVQSEHLSEWLGSITERHGIVSVRAIAKHPLPPPAPEPDWD